jgi:hypothetical protein
MALPTEVLLQLNTLALVHRKVAGRFHWLGFQKSCFEKTDESKNDGSAKRARAAVEAQ